MTRSKLDLAKILVSLRGDDSDPMQVAKEMTLMKLCHEIQKIEEQAQTPEPTEPPEPAPEQEAKTEQPTSRPKREKHIFSWLLDSDTDEE
jgi:ribosome-binding protein aMBF1 (putative translation factor)